MAKKTNTKKSASKKSKQAKKKVATPNNPAPDLSPWQKLHNEVNQTSEPRQRLLEKLEKEFDATVVSFFKSFKHPNSQIADPDAEMLESILMGEHKPNGRLLLIINAPGGDALAAERIANVCRAYSNGNFEILVPHMAKSAATMICFGANVIHMSKTAELGPVDPQVGYSDDAGNNRWISAEEYVRSYEVLMNEASSGNHAKIEPYLLQLNRYDSRFIEQLRSAQKLSEDISIRLLQSGMLKGQSETQIRKAIEVFLLQEKTSSHGRMINHDGVKKCGLTVNILDYQTDLWNLIWELFVRSDWVVTNKCLGLLESPRFSVHAG